MNEGIYDNEAESLLREHRAIGVLVAMVGGTKGHGFSVAARDPAVIQALPKILRDMASDIEKGASMSVTVTRE